MTVRSQHAPQPPLSDKKRLAIHSRVLTHSAASVTEAITDAVVIKDENIFFLCKPDGEVPLRGHHGYGLYFHDCRFLNGYVLRVNGKPLNGLGYSSDWGFGSVFELTSGETPGKEGTALEKDELGLRWSRILDHKTLTLRESLVFNNYTKRRIELSLEFSFQAEFEDIFAIRGLFKGVTGKFHGPRWEKRAVTFLYEGADGWSRETRAEFSLPIKKSRDGSARVLLRLEPEKNVELSLCIAIRQSQGALHSRAPIRMTRLATMQRALERKEKRTSSQFSSVDTDSPQFNRIVERAVRDLHMLRSHMDGREYFAAGVPWFVTLFGRDTLITTIQALAFNPSFAEGTIKILCDYQGKRVDPWKMEEPGKILHTIRVGEMAHLNEIPHTPFYGTVDSTLLFLLLITRHAQWTGSLDLFRRFLPNIEAALHWAKEYGDKNKDGYVEYTSETTGGMVNQGWKDSGNAIVNSDGSAATPPISLIEVQAYLYAAKKELAELFHRNGQPDRGRLLQKEAEELKRRLNRDFWLKKEKFFSMAMQKNGRLSAAVASNPGHALWAGAIEPIKAKQVARRLMGGDMFNGWGIQTLASTEKAFNPLAYHLGTVWPFDNSLIAAGLKNYGFDQEAGKIFESMVDAATFFEHYRLPELWSGFSRKNFDSPIRYPVASHPQAWSAGAPLYLIETILGLKPEGFEEQLKIVRPWLPTYVQRLTMKNVRVGKASVDLKFFRSVSGRTEVEVLRQRGDLKVLVLPSRSA